MELNLILLHSSMAAAKRKPATSESWNYEATVEQIEATLNQIERGDLDLAATFEQFTTAIAQLKQCEAFLNERQEQVDLLIETLNDADF
jgi:exodeoxyribonuclease VII small subunit